MRKIIVWTRVSMDGVMQAQPKPEDDPQTGFRWTGWTQHYQDEEMGKAFSKMMSIPFDLLLGRGTYEIFKEYWPKQTFDVANAMNRGNKYVVSTKPIDLSWKGSVLICQDVVSELKKLTEQEGPDLLVFGSGLLLQTLLANHLVDVLHIWTFPVTLGAGQKLFQEGIPAQQWK